MWPSPARYSKPLRLASLLSILSLLANDCL
jgi:hypothetical protein